MNVLSDSSTKEQTVTIRSQSTHQLNSEWCFWYASRKEKDRNIPYEKRLIELGKFSTIEDFFKHYMYIKSASEVERNTDFALFKTGFKPLWECCPGSAMWFIRYKKNDNPEELDIKWERILFALLGEEFNEPNMLGALLSIRGRETIIEIWFTYDKNDQIKAQILKNLNSLLKIENTNLFYFKDNQISLKVSLKNHFRINLP